MRLISWNVNGLRACAKKGFADFFLSSGADCVCLQETKMAPGQLDIGFEGYSSYWNSADKKGYSGTALFTRREPSGVTLGIEIDRHDHEGRVICADFGGFYIVNVYTPNARRELERLDYRMDWEDDFRRWLLALDSRKPVVVCGDLNVAHREIDLKNPKSNTRNAGFTPQERGKMTELLASGFTDTFRYINGDVTGAYSWWSYMGNARERNAGWRIDYFLVSNRLAEKITGARILSGVYGSDHCPVELEIDL